MKTRQVKQTYAEQFANMTNAELDATYALVTQHHTDAVEKLQFLDHKIEAVRTEHNRRAKLVKID